MSKTYGLGDAGEAAEYLRDSVLRARLVAATEAVNEQLRKGVSLNRLMGSRTDALKLVSSLTLFEHVARTLHEARGLEEHGSLAQSAGEVLNAAASQGYARCAVTVDRLAGWSAFAPRL
jgi:hypothetical protein